MVVGGGGREHAIIKALKKNQEVSEIYCLPGNGGVQNIPDLHKNAKLTVVSSTSTVEGGYHDVTLRFTEGKE